MENVNVLLERIQPLVEGVVRSSRDPRLGGEGAVQQAMETVLGEVQYWPSWYRADGFGAETHYPLRAVRATHKTKGLESAVGRYVAATAGSEVDVSDATMEVVKRVVRWAEWYWAALEDVEWSGYQEEASAYDEAYVSAYGEGDNGTGGVF